jgi:hypothetical protein
MSPSAFELGLTATDRDALREARHLPLPIDGDAALRFIRDASVVVAEAVRRRPPLGGAPFELPNHRETAAAGDQT